MSITPDTIPDDFRVPLDMAHVVTEATKPAFKLTFDCFGKEFHCVARGTALVAETTARQRLADTFPEFCRYDARLTACIEVDA